MKTKIILSAAVLSAALVISCGKNESFTYETADEVDLGLSVVWAGRNFGAAESVDPGTAVSFDADPFAKEWTLPGEGWRKPTLDEWEELNSCSSRIVKVGSRNAILFTGKNGNGLLLPFAGVVAGDIFTMHDLCDNVWMRYWSSDNWPADSSYAVSVASRKDSKLTQEPHLKAVPASLRLVRPLSSAGL